MKLEGTPLAALGFSEPTGSANWLQNEGGKGIQTFARVQGNEVVINGGKIWASSSGGVSSTPYNMHVPHLRLTSPSPVGVQRSGGALSGMPVQRPRRTSRQRRHRRHHTQGVRRSRQQGLLQRRRRHRNPRRKCPPPFSPHRQDNEDLHQPHQFRASSGPRTKFTNFRVPAKNILATPGKGAMVNVAAFTESAALVGAGAAGLMRSCFNHTLAIVTTDARGGARPTINYQTVADYLISMKMRQETTRYLTWKACHYLETTGEAELAYQAKVYGSETAIQCVLEGMQAVGVTSYDTSQPYGLFMDDAICLPIFEGSNAGIRRRQIQKIFGTPGYDPESCASNRVWSTPVPGFPKGFLKCHI